VLESQAHVISALTIATRTLTTMLLIFRVLHVQMDELLDDINNFDTRFKRCWDFDDKYEKKIGKMLASLE